MQGFLFNNASKINGLRDTLSATSQNSPLRIDQIQSGEKRSL